MRDVQWLYQLLGKLHAENTILREELDKSQAALAEALKPKADAPAEKPAA